MLIADLLAAGNTVGAIAGQVGRSPSTISREIRRNADTDGRYRPHHAERATRQRARRPRQRRVVVDPVLGDTVREFLGRRWSPEQVVHELAVRFAGQRRRCLCTESVYQAIYDPGVDVTPSGSPTASPTTPTRRTSARTMVAMRMIGERPAEVEDRVEAGHWEGGSDHGDREPLSDRHARRAVDPVSDPVAPSGRRLNGRDRRPGD